MIAVFLLLLVCLALFVAATYSAIGKGDVPSAVMDGSIALALAFATGLMLGYMVWMP